MALRDLTTPTMVVLSASWLDPDAERPVLESLSQAGALLPSLDKAHKGLLHSQSTGDSASAEIAALQLRAAIVDAVHDHKARGSYGLLTALAEIADEPATGARYIALRDKLYPDGLELVRWSYTDEAGDAKLVDKRLTPEDKEFLKAIPIPHGTLYDVHMARVKAGKELGEIEKQRTALEKQAPGAPTAADGARARNLWIRTVNALLSLLELEEKLSEGDRDRLLAPLRRAEQKAARRGGASAKESAPEGMGDSLRGSSPGESKTS